MLSKQEQEQRALAISKLYGKPLLRKSEDNTTAIAHSWPTSLLVAATYTFPFAVTNALFSFYNNNDYSSTTEIQASSMLFVLFFIVLAGLFILFIKFSKDELYKKYVTSMFIFTGTTIIMLPVFFYLHEFIAGQAPQSLNEILIRVILFSCAGYLLTLGAIAGLTTTAYRYINKK
ncbi:MAG: hypothetical protein JWM52_310 [Candidatus Saccharibacteria bacterium]|nr:hypothetical protein [Candidatus Saccharibacteria bacterium]